MWRMSRRSAFSEGRRGSPQTSGGNVKGQRQRDTEKLAEDLGQLPGVLEGRGRRSSPEEG